MKIAVANTVLPFAKGGAEYLEQALIKKLIEQGHEVCSVRIPFKWHPQEQILINTLAAENMVIDGADLLIALKFPAYCIPHSNKVIWLLHQFRQAYDLWDTPYQDLMNDINGLEIRNGIINVDNKVFKGAKKIYACSEVVAKRLKFFNEFESKVLHCPLLSEHIYYHETEGDYIFCPSRMTEGKRQHLLIEAMKYTKTPVKLILAGLPESKEYLLRLQNLIATNELGNKVTLLPTFISESEKCDYFSRCLAVAYIPVDEDSYGYVTLEAFYSGKTVVTALDSGGIHLLVKDQESGYIVEPRAKEFARVFDQMFLHKNKLISLAQNGLNRSKNIGISWERVIKELTE